MSISHRIAVVATKSGVIQSSTTKLRSRLPQTINQIYPLQACVQFTHPTNISHHQRCFYHSTSASLQSAAEQTSPTSPKVAEIFDKILQLDTIEVHLLTELVNEKMGIKPMSAAQRQAMARGVSGGGGGGAAGGQAEEKVAEKTAFELKLTGFDAKSKIKVIKEVRTITGLGLKEAKEMVEGAPKTLKKDIKKEEAEELQKQLEAVGGTVEIV